MILSDAQISYLCRNNELVSPFDPANVQPASIDIKLGNHFRVFDRSRVAAVDMRDPVDITKPVYVPDGDHFTLHHGEFVLGHTYETVTIPNGMVARVEGKSSIGRLGLFVHITAGYIDPGFAGQVTLEIACLHPLPIKLYPGMLIGQISFHEMSEHAEDPYSGRYQGDLGVVASRYTGATS